MKAGVFFEYRTGDINTLLKFAKSIAASSKFS